MKEREYLEEEKGSDYLSVLSQINDNRYISWVKSADNYNIIEHKISFL